MSTRSAGIARFVVPALVLLGSLAARAEDGVKPNQSLVVTGVPPIPSALRERVAPYLEIRTASFDDWSPRRRSMLVSTRFGDTVQLHEVASPLGMRKQLTFYAERIAGALYRPVTGDGFVFAKDTGGSEFYQLYWRDAGGRTTLLTDGRSRNLLGRFSRDGRFLAYTSTRRNGKDDDIYLVDPTDPKTDRMLIQVEGGGWIPSDWSPDGRTLLLREYISANECHLFLADVETRTRTPLAGAGRANEKIAVDGACFSADGASIFFASDEASEFRELRRLDLAKRTVTSLTSAIHRDVDAFDLSPDGRLVAFTANEGGADTLHIRDLATGAERPLPALPLAVIGSLKFHRSLPLLAFTMSSATSPSDAYALDLESGKLERWTESETGGLDPSSFAEPERIRWKSFDGLELEGFLYRPPSRFAGPRPVVVLIHGGPEGQSKAGFLGRLNYLVNELGVAILFPNVRGSGGFGKTFLLLDNAEKREDSVKDVGALLDWIAARKDLDASRVMVSGGSYGGYMSLASMVHYSARLRCGIDVVGISNFVTFLEHTESYRRDLRRVEYGDERDPKMRSFLTEISPLTHAGEIKKPMLIAQGRNDPRVPWTEAEQIVGALSKSGIPVCSILAKDEGHGFQKKKNADFLFLAEVAFMERFLVGETGAEAAALDALAREYWEAHAAAHPVGATERGDRRFDDRLEDSSPDGIATWRARVTGLLERAQAISATALASGDRMTRSALVNALENELVWIDAHFEEWLVDPLGGPQVELLNIPSLQIVRTPEEGRGLLARWRAMTPYMVQHTANLRRGLAAGKVATRVAVEKTISELDALLARPVADWPLLSPLREVHASFDEAFLRSWREDLVTAVESLRGAFRVYRSFLADEVLERARPAEKAGLCNIPGGRETYRALIRAHTSLDLAPDALHALGLDEIARIERETSALGEKALGTPDLAEIRKRLRADENLYFRTREEVHASADAALSKARKAIPRWFATLPKAACEVVDMAAHEEENSTIAYYREPAADGSRPGRFMINTYAPRTRPRYQMEALAFHEGIPGHHLQIAISEELTGIPEFRKHGEVTAFVEGWGLYSEKLADEMGLYSSDLDRLGKLSQEAWRACRLVVDTGMHDEGWSRQQAIDFMTAHSALAENNIVNEVDRYIAWPAQALAYKVGELEILKLRAQAEKRLGARFDIRAFHVAVLKNGAVTLPMLREGIEAYIARAERPE